MKAKVLNAIVVVGAILSAVSVFLPLGFLEIKGFDPSYTKNLMDSDNPLAMTVIVISVVVAGLWIGRFFVSEKWLLVFSKVAGILAGLVLLGLSVMVFMYLQSLKNLAGNSPVPYFGLYAIAIGAILVFVGSVFSKNDA